MPPKHSRDELTPRTGALIAAESMRKLDPVIAQVRLTRRLMADLESITRRIETRAGAR